MTLALRSMRRFATAQWLLKAAYISAVCPYCTERGAVGALPRALCAARADLVLCVGLGLVIQQLLHYFHVAAVGGQHQRRVAELSAHARKHTHARAAVQAAVAGAWGVSGNTHLILNIRVRARLAQLRHGGRLAVLGLRERARAHQRARRVRCGHRTHRLQQQPRLVGVPRCARRHRFSLQVSLQTPGFTVAAVRRINYSPTRFTSCVCARTWARARTAAVRPALLARGVLLSASRVVSTCVCVVERRSSER